MYAAEVLANPCSATILAATAMLAVVAACGGDHSRLAKGDGGSGGASSGSGGSGGETTSQSGGTGGSGGFVEPPGPTKLTVVNGVVDQDAVRICFLPYPDAAGSGALPWPGVQGLPFARGAAPDLQIDLPEQGDVELVVMAGTLSATGGKGCLELITTVPSGVELQSVGVLPASALAEDKSLLLVLGGCLGGAGHSHEQEEVACGPGYSELTPNVSVLAGFMSRIVDADAVALQFAQGSLALPPLRLRVKPGDAGAQPALAVDSWTPGAIAPFPPLTSLTKLGLQIVDQAELLLYDTSSSEPIHRATWQSALANSALSSADVSDGRGLVFISVGASWNLGAGPWWHGYTYTVVPADP